MQKNIEIIKVVSSDIDTISHMEREIFEDFWSRESIVSECKNKFSHIYMCNLCIQIGDSRFEKRPLAYYFANYIDGEMSLNRIGVLKEFRRENIGTSLMGHFMNLGKELGAKSYILEVSVNNKAAINLYEKFAFKIIDKRKNYYQKAHEDAYIMQKGSLYV